MFVISLILSSFSVCPAVYSLLIHMFIYCKYEGLLALQYQFQYPVFTLSSHVAGLRSQY